MEATCLVFPWWVNFVLGALFGSWVYLVWAHFVRGE